jgi:peptide/nickel transport system substrate-binding protein
MGGRPPASGAARTLAGLVAVLVLLAGCGSSSSHAQPPGTSGRPVAGGTMTIAVGADANGWNPHQDEWAQGSALMGSAVLEPLATTGHDLSAKPWLAKSWTPNADFTSWTIVLRPNVQFQNGQALDATAVKQNLDDASTAPLSGQALKGLFRVVTVVDPLTVRVDLTQPWAAFPSSFLDGQSAMMMAPAMLDAAGGGQNHPIGTGPYTFVSWQPGSTFALKKNPHYWQAGLPHLDRLDFKVLNDPTTQQSALQAGEVDMLFSSDALVAEHLASSFAELRDWSTEPGTALTNTVRSIDGVANPMADRHARMALAYATNRQAIVAAIAPGLQTPSSPFSPSSPWGMPESQNGYPSFDPNKARQEVAAYEKDTGQSSLSFKLSGSSDAATGRVMSVLQAQWKQVGMRVDIQAIDQASLISAVVAGRYEVAMFTFYSSPDPDQNHYFWSAATANGVGKVSINFTQYSNPQMEADLKVGRQNPSFAARQKAYDDLVRQLNAAAVNIWTFATPYSLIASHNVQGLAYAKTAPFGNFQPKTWLGNLWLS